MLGKIEGGREEDETVGWHHQLDGHEFEQALGPTLCDPRDGGAWWAADYGVEQSQT